jgi:2-polyprenyl-3-methyl-5-hydroxy-6-metoxy-1,4-benzoquinol methylase
MNAAANDAQTIQDFKQLKNRLKTTWMTGDYDLFSRFMRKGAEGFFRRLGVTAGTRLLDVGCGAGQLALIAARAGAQVIGCDIATNWLKRARARVAAERLEITFEVRYVLDSARANGILALRVSGRFELILAEPLQGRRISTAMSRTHPGQTD